jgi:hypothetical protein
MLLFGSTLLKHGRHFNYRIQPPKMRMRVCYLDVFIVEKSSKYCRINGVSDFVHRPDSKDVSETGSVSVLR